MSNITRPEDFGMPEFPELDNNNEEIQPAQQPANTTIPSPYYQEQTGPNGQFTTQGGLPHSPPCPSREGGDIDPGTSRAHIHQREPPPYLEGDATQAGTGTEQTYQEQPRRVELVDRPAPIEGPIGPLPLPEEPRGTKGGRDDNEEEEEEEEGELEFPQQVYHILLVGAEGVGQTSMILSHVNGHWTDAGKMEKSLWNRLFKKIEKNRVYEVDLPIDSYDIKLVLWDASLSCAGDMNRRNRTGWDAVVLCSDATEPTTLDEPFKWWMAFRQDIRPSTNLPIVTEIAALKRDLLSPRRYNISREHGEFTAASFDSAHYSELSSKTRAGLREFWYSLLRQILRGRVEAWMEEVRRSKLRRERLAERRGKYRASTYRALTGERPDREL